MTTAAARRPDGVLWLLFGLFFLRVLGQVLVAFVGVTWLPSMRHWYSGLISYPYLLASQIVMLAGMAKVNADFTRGDGWFARPNPPLGRAALWFGWLYLSSMILRYAITRTLIIPVTLHCVLAIYLILIGRYHRSAGAQSAQGAQGAQGPSKFLGATRAGVVALALTILMSGGCRAIVSRRVLPHDTRPGQFAVRIERGLSMRTADDVGLVADVYHPDRSGKGPTILVRVPFSDTRSNRLAADVIGHYWASRGYTVVIQGTRGRFRSSGRYYPLRHEREDGIDTLAWLASQPWYDGRLGMWGGSTFGYTQWVLADRSSPGPSALMVQISSTDFHGMFYPGDAFALESALYWAVRSRGEKDVTPDQRDLQHGYDGFPLIEADNRAAGDIPFFNDWATHTSRDDYWAAIDGDDRAGRLKAPVLLMAGWFDPFLPTQLEDFSRIRRAADPAVARQSRLIVGPWAHARAIRFPDGTAGGQYRVEALAPSVDWFDQHLGSPAGSRERSVPPVRIFVMGENIWRDEQEWPLERARNRAYYLASSARTSPRVREGVLLLRPPDHDEPDLYSYDPRRPTPTAGGAMLGPRAGIADQTDVERRPDVLLYSTPPLEQDTEVTGPVQAILHVATDAPSTDFTAKLVDVHADGRAWNVTDGILRRRYAAAEPIEITIDLWPTSMVFRKGHRIRLEVSSSNYPRFDRNPNTGRTIATETETRVARQTIFHDARRPSRLLLPIVPRDR